jgi:hypothetical protein
MVYGTYVMTAPNLTGGVFSVPIDPSMITGDGTYYIALKGTADDGNDVNFGNIGESDATRHAKLTLNYVYEDSTPTTSNLVVRNNDTAATDGISIASSRSALLSFTVSGSTGRTIDSAAIELYLYPGQNNYVSFEVRKLGAAFTTATIYSDIFGSTPTIPMDSTVYGTYVMTAANLTGGVFSVPIDPSMITGDGIYYIALKGTADDGNDVNFGNIGESDTTRHAKLVLAFDQPESTPTVAATATPTAGPNPDTGDPGTLSLLVIALAGLGGIAAFRRK